LNHEGQGEHEGKIIFSFVHFMAFVVFCLWCVWPVAAQQTGRQYVDYADAKPIFDALRADLLPSEFRDKNPAEREAMWPGWIMQRDVAIRARIAAGDEDSIINFLLYGTSFTRRPRPTDRQLADLVERPSEALAWLRPRIDDFVRGLATPDTNERLLFAREVLRGKGDAKQYLEQRAIEMSATGALRTRALLGASSPDVADRLTIFRDRGLSSDTSIFIDYGIDATLEAMKTQGAISAGAVGRVAIIGPGLDFSDKLDGYDFYPPQTIQPFAVVDSLLRLGLAASTGVQVTAFDLSPRILTHLDAARMRAQAGRPYQMVLPRNVDQAWSAPLTRYWQRMGDRVGAKGPAVMPPANAGRADVRSMLVRPNIVLSVAPHDLNVVLQRPDPAAAPFDLVIATNILLYYDVFEQSLAGINIAKMLRPGWLSPYQRPHLRAADDAVERHWIYRRDLHHTARHRQHGCADYLVSATVITRRLWPAMRARRRA
jgi:hypothetical protein